MTDAQREIVRQQLLVSALWREADPAAFGPDANNALHVAARGGKHALLERLLTPATDIDAVNRRGESALYLAADVGCLPCVRLMLERGVPMRDVSRKGMGEQHGLPTRTSAVDVQGQRHRPAPCTAT